MAPGGAVRQGHAIAHMREQVRLAMAWNGGVSLAVWMGGMAVELNAARRAGSDRSDEQREPERRDPQKRDAQKRDPQKRDPKDRRRSEELYGAICAAFDRELQIDILCGASAGGINSALLAGEIERDGGRLTPDFLRDEWLRMGDFETLLQPLGNEQPAALMQGRMFFERLKEVFGRLLGEGEPAMGPAKVLLDIQVTDVEGEQHVFMDEWQATLFAREYRSPVRFRRSEDYTAGTLAAAARASASFPGAFEAQRLTGIAARLAGFPDRERWAIDGGVLENAPIRQAIELIPTRRSSGPVKRFVCYVNADPSPRETPKEEPQQPKLAEVLGYALTLPLKARMIDQLRALNDAKRRGELAPTGLELLAVGRDALRDTAQALLPSYRRRRARLSLEELLRAPEDGSGPVLAGPALATRALEGLTGPASLPWLSGGLTVAGSRWGWGVRAAQRVVQVELDYLSAALAKTELREDADVAFAARAAIDRNMERLEAEHRDFVDPTGAVAEGARDLCAQDTREAALEALTRKCAGIDVTVLAALEGATAAFGDAVERLSEDARAGLAQPQQLFGEGNRTSHFLELGLMIEVIRRSLSDEADIEPAQPLHLAQLSPLTATPLLSRDPLDQSAPGPCTTEEKLTGIRLGHFAAFYRGSWRANDFMWGRLDGAAQTARLLIDDVRAKALQAYGASPGTVLARALVPAPQEERDMDRCSLVSEVLEPRREGVCFPLRFDEAAAKALRERTAARIEADLRDDGRLTFVLCARALQYEVLVQEAPALVAQAKLDRAAGASMTSLKWDLSGSLWDVLEQLRGWVGKQALPVQLGRDSPDERTSDLAARTVSHAAITALAAVTTSVPLARLFQPARVPLFAVQGVTAKRALDRAAAVLGFTGAAWYVAARNVTMPERVGGVPLGALWSVKALVLWVALLAVIGVTAMPLARCVLGERWPRRAAQGALAAALAATGGGVALGWQWALHGTAVALTSSAARYAPPEALLWMVAAAGGFHVTSQLESVSRVLDFVHRTLLKDLVSTTSLLAGGLGGALAYFTMRDTIWPAHAEHGWKLAIFVLALAAPLVALACLRVWDGPLTLARTSDK